VGTWEKRVWIERAARGRALGVRACWRTPGIAWRPVRAEVDSGRE